MISKIFSPEGLLWRILNVLTDIFALSVLWLLCCIPVITVGAATTALYDSVVRCIRYKQRGAYRRFFDTLRADLPTSVFSALLWGAVIALFIWVIKYLQYLGGFSASARMASVAYYVLLLIPVGAACWAFPILSRFTFGFAALNITAVKFAFAKLPSTVILVLLTTQIIELCINWLFPSFFMPAVMMLLWSLFIEPAFKKAGGGIAGASPEEQKE